MAVAKIILDKRYESPNGGYVVKLRVTDERKSKYFPTGHKKDALQGNKIADTLELNRKFTQREFDAITNGKRLTDKQKEYRQAFASFEAKAVECINALPVFSFEGFEKLYMINRGAKDSLKIAFDEKAKELRADGKISSAVNFECGIKSIEKYKEGLRLAGVTPAFLKAYERHMLDNGKSKSTVGIYLRSLRVIMNEAVADGRLDKSLYPFRKAKAEKGRYVIPTSRNIKKAMSTEDLSKLFYFQSEEKAMQQAADFWRLSFLSNGMNIKDILNLRWKNIDGDYIKFERSKTSDTKDVSEPIIAHLKPEAMAIIRKYSVKSLSPESLVFPVLSDKMDAETQYMKIQNFVHHINKNLAKICKDLKIPKITTYAARHSFATRLMQNGATATFIQKSLGHTSSKTTAAYLGSFENDAIKDITDKIIPIREAK